MVLATLAVIGLLMGAGGLVVAVLAYRRTVSKTGDTGSAVQRLLKDDRQGIDPRAVRDVAVVRYDALREMAGELSFSLALLDATGDGVVITSINGRSETRTYAKAVEGGKGVQQLSPEEWRVVRDARMGKGPGRYTGGSAGNAHGEPADDLPRDRAAEDAAAVAADPVAEPGPDSRADHEETHRPGQDTPGQDTRDQDTRDQDTRDQDNANGGHASGRPTQEATA